MLKTKNKLLKITVAFLALILLFLCLSFSVSADETGEIIKNEEYTKVYPGGMTFGVKMNRRGVVVAETTSFISEKKSVSPAKDGGISENDVILKINSKNVLSAKDFTEKLQKYQNKPITLTVMRNGGTFKALVTPKADDGDGKVKIGISVRDTAAGIGTVTFITEDGIFGGLGHPVSDSDGKSVDFIRGDIYEVKIDGVQKATGKAPGELIGRIMQTKTGFLISNTEVGTFGVFTDCSFDNTAPMEVADRSDVKIGEATVLSALDSSVSEYKISIDKIDFSNNVKNFEITVTDERLIEKSGGIVQGMSGSPIIQNGKIVGAVTHVLVSDSLRGYGIYIGNMLNECPKAYQ